MTTYEFQRLKPEQVRPGILVYFRLVDNYHAIEKYTRIGEVVGEAFQQDKIWKVLLKNTQDLTDNTTYVRMLSEIWIR